MFYDDHKTSVETRTSFEGGLMDVLHQQEWHFYIRQAILADKDMHAELEQMYFYLSTTTS